MRPLLARVARREEEASETQTTEDDGFMTVPYEGLVGAERGGLFDTPLNIFDPMQDIAAGDDNSEGERPSDEKIQAIQAKIRQRVEALKAAGEWGEDGEEFGKDPLAGIPIWSTMAMQLKTCKPFESPSDLALTYSLILLTTVMLSAYLLTLRDSFDAFIIWYQNTDFDGDFVSGLFRAASN